MYSSLLMPSSIVERCPVWVRAVGGVLLRSFRDNPPVLVFTMGKVGSTAITQALRSNSIPNPVYHIHALSSSRLAGMRELFQEKDALFDGVAHHYWTSRALRWKLGDIQQSDLLVISGMRDPVARFISGTFQNVSLLEHLLDDEGQFKPEKTTEYINSYMESSDAPQNSRIMVNVDSFFKNEIEGTLGIDVLKYPFDKERGFRVIRSENISMLLYKVERLDEVVSDGLRNFLDSDEMVTVPAANKASDKWYADEYRDAKNRFTLSPAQADRLYDSSYVKHFYSEEEIASFKKRWTR